MSDDTSLAVAVLARLDALELRVAILEAERAALWSRLYSALPIDYTVTSHHNNTRPTYEHYVDPTMRETRNGH